MEASLALGTHISLSQVRIQHDKATVRSIVKVTSLGSPAKYQGEEMGELGLTSRIPESLPPLAAAGPYLCTSAQAGSPTLPPTPGPPSCLLPSGRSLAILQGPSSHLHHLSS